MKAQPRRPSPVARRPSPVIRPPARLSARKPGISSLVLALGFLLGQPQAQAPRTSFTFYLYVNPIHGDDQAAFDMNPAAAPGGDWATHFGAAIPKLNKNFITDALGVAPPVAPMVPNPFLLGKLIHAPYPFKTITKSKGALAYIQQILLGGVPLIQFPHTMGNTHTIERVVIHCLPGLYGPNPNNDTDPDSGLRWNDEDFPVRMPHRVSLQGASALDTIFDARNFAADPADIAAGGNSIICFVPPFFPAPPGEHWFDKSFVDGITIRNNTRTVNRFGAGFPFGNWGNGSGCGVYIGGSLVPGADENAPTVSNCFIVGNMVGIALESESIDLAVTQLEPPSALIVNNTIARNVVDTDPDPVGLVGFGIWNGNRFPPLATPTQASKNFGWAQPILLNNIIDGPRATYVAPSGPSFPTGALAFAGIHWDDLLLVDYTPLPAGIPVAYSVNHNAYQYSTGPAPVGSIWTEVLTAANLAKYTVVPGALAPVWPVPAVVSPVAIPQGPLALAVLFRTSAIAASYGPKVDITPYTDPTGAVALYINDIFRNYIDAGSTPRSQHDFRLAPQSRTLAGAVGVNPLVGAGFNESPDGTNANAAGNVVIAHSYSPRTKPLPLPNFPPTMFPPTEHSQDFPTASMHFWDWDADGFGNKRIQVNNWFTAAANPAGDIDIGADEVGDVVISGYLNSTRIFSQPHTDTAAAVTVSLTRPAIDQFYFGVTGQVIPLRPFSTSYLGSVERWYQHVESFGYVAGDKDWTHTPGPTPLMPVAQWTKTAVGSFRNLRIVTGPMPLFQAKDPGIPRSQLCDFGTLLLPDPKPWGLLFGTPLTRDKYCSSPWYNNGPEGRWSNQAAYWYPPSDGPASANSFFGHAKPFVCMVTPPGTMENDVSFGMLPAAPFHQSNLDLALVIIQWLHHQVPATATITFDAWGVGDSGVGASTPLNTLVYDPGAQWMGIRVNVEGFFPGTANELSNLQTFLLINGNVDEGLNRGQGAKTGSFGFKYPSADDLSKSVARAMSMMTSKDLEKALAERSARLETIQAIVDRSRRK